MPDALTLTVAEVAVETPGTRRMSLALDGVPFAYRAGQGVALGLHGQPERRPYSIACAPHVVARTGALEFLLRVDAAGQPGLHLDGVRAGSRVDVEGPFGALTLPETGAGGPLVFIAAGTGITPLRALMQAAVERGHRGPMPLVYSVRTPEDVAYAQEWAAWERDGRGAVDVIVTRPAAWRPGARHYRLQPSRLEALAHAHAGGWFFTCGPPAFVDEVVATLSHAGVRSERVRREGW